ncbi:pyridoxal-phosphate dependent enzyme [Streptomyces sp. Ac-502]|uniref:pyridoxal-phosphate dependent enzyme n=1 Tax=Streptomyces sp. Ac-502 TaxID=3342801 RepID=UPI0038621E8A
MRGLHRRGTAARAGRADGSAGCRTGAVRRRLPGPQRRHGAGRRGTRLVSAHQLLRPSPGGNPYADEGYKSVAYELARDFAGRRIGAVVVPTCRADLLSGIERGFRELAAAGLVSAAPRMVAAEPAGAAPFTAALRHADRAAQERTRVKSHPTAAFSLGEERPCWQGLDALWRSGGTAVAVAEKEFVAEQRRLAEQGMLLEASSAVAVSVARRMLRELPELVVAIGTATGMKELASAGE